ncbi:acyl-CoA thioesterase II [Paracoccidioides lutzii Pb01]|uniref:Acyl-CoA thioesterase II n=1 Tax=Paracoccidioides lutzii (strain ATCC MYA-826 / Pb01) TaxID=502779 RepID=C1GUF5_PARBA|nr:acyl-CoA thioesterase II [Paracoccidioides lutzii Pb01]EEH39961.2 acyl-CoA thioesterase II [Paracoccidioides lutzii Pb01]
MQVTLFEAPPEDPSKSQIENILELTPVSDFGPDVFTNTRPLWHPPAARGIYGGAAIAQSLAAAQLTVSPGFSPHSMHCYFVLAGDAEIPIIYHVERVREGRSFATRTVQARQKGKPIFTTTISFDREGSGGEEKVEHSTPKPNIALPPANASAASKGPFETRNAGVVNRNSPRAEEKAIYQFFRARGTISAAGGQQAHLSALAYMSDSYFIGTIARVQNIPRFASPDALKHAISKLKNPSDLDSEEIERSLKELLRQEAAEFYAEAMQDSKVDPPPPKREMGMMVSLDHTIYFHARGGFRADEWLFIEMTSPWAGGGRGLVMQKMWSQDGTLLLTCVQEVRAFDPNFSPVLPQQIANASKVY